MRNTRIWYQYVNKANTKRNGYIVVSGIMSNADIKAVNQSLEKGMLFIPSQVGVPTLAGSANEDHVWHRLDLSQMQETMERATVGEDGQAMTVAALVDNFSMTIWNPSAETARMFNANQFNVAKTSPKARVAH